MNPPFAKKKKRNFVLRLDNVAMEGLFADFFR